MEEPGSSGLFINIIFSDLAQSGFVQVWRDRAVAQRARAPQPALHLCRMRQRIAGLWHQLCIALVRRPAHLRGAF